MDVIIGIDLGTTNSEVAVIENGRVVVIKDEEGHDILPSVVGLGDQGTLLVGRPARNQFVLYPERTVRSIKREMGRDTHVDLEGTRYTPQEISAMILMRLKGIAEAHLKHPVSKAVITVPAYFSDTQRQATREAGEIAGLEVVRMINEPTAAALSYEAGHTTNRRSLVYDLGGGTFDVSVVSMAEDVVEVIASAGNNHLGGDDFDQVLMQHLATHLREQHGLYADTDRRLASRLLRAAEDVKITLSDQPYARVDEEYIGEVKGVPVHLSMEISREDYEEMITPLINQTLESVHVALRDAKLTASDIDDILLVGGATRTPLVQKRLEQEFRRAPRADVHPDLCVAMGAAIQAQMIAGGEAPAVLVDITPYTFGTSALGEVNGIPTLHMYVPIIHRNTPIPVTKTEVFYTVHDNQEAVNCRIYQGEDPDALNNIEIGQFWVTGLGKAAAGSPILLQLALDINGILHVSAQEKNTGLKRSITIDNAISRFEAGEIEQARKRMDALFGHKETDNETTVEVDRETQHMAVQANAVLEKAGRLLDATSDDDQEDMINLMEALRDALGRADWSAVKETMDELSDIIFYLES